MPGDSVTVKVMISEWSVVKPIKKREYWNRWGSLRYFESVSRIDFLRIFER